MSEPNQTLPSAQIPNKAVHHYRQYLENTYSRNRRINCTIQEQSIRTSCGSWTILTRLEVGRRTEGSQKEYNNGSCDSNDLLTADGRLNLA